MRHVAVTSALLAGLATLSLPTPARAETRRALEAEARKYGAPMVWIKDGAFTMGSQNGLSKTQPPHEVYLNAFYIDQYEVTTARYAKFLESTEQGQPRPLPMSWEQVNLSDDGDRPVTGVTWTAADAYCRWVSKRLPSEAEWEKAARGADGRTYPWGNEEPTFKLANYDKPVAYNFYSDSLRPVDSYEAGKSPYGAYDMAGNVWEWVADWYDPAYYEKSPAKNPTGPGTGTDKVLRSSGWAVETPMVRIFTRVKSDPFIRNESTGFRCAMSAPRN